MRKFVTALMGLALAYAVATDGSFAAPSATAAKLTPAPLPPAETQAFVDGLVRDAMRGDHISGVTVAIVQNGKVVLAKGYGAASREPWRPVTADTPFRIGSTSKTLTWILLMREVEKGRLRLDARVNDYLPAAARFPDAGFRRPILVRDLMSHSAGLEDLALGHLAPSHHGAPLALDLYVIKHQPRRVREPGQIASYCNYCAVLAGYIVSRLEGLDYESVVERDITGPLAMTHTSFRDVGARRAGMPAPMSPVLADALSQGFSWKDQAFVARPSEPFAQITPAGGAATSANDMARYMEMLLNNGVLGTVQVYGPATAAAFRTPILRTDPGISGWDHGFMQTTTPGGFTAYGHGGDTTLFHAQMEVVPELGLGVFISTNTDTGGKLANRLPDLLIAHFYAAEDAAPQGPAKIDARLLKPYAGTYLATRRAAGGVEGFLGLMQAASLSVSPAGLVGDNGAVWIPDGAKGRFREKGGTRVLTFSFQDGKPYRWRTTINANENVRANLWRRPEPFMAVTGLALLAAVATLVGLFVRRRSLAKTPWQGLAGVVQAAAAVAWITSVAGLAKWISGADDNYSLLMNWPEPSIVAFVWGGALAAVLSAAGVILLIPVWRGQGWGPWRKVRFSMTSVLFGALALTLFLRGALDVWSI
jgi:CubicO group peptidase (beta-lactamase class C family)